MPSFRRRRTALGAGAVLFVLAVCSLPIHAGTITIGGAINQSTQDSGNPAVNNPSLNNIADGNSYSVALNFNGAITSPGTYALTSILFTDPAAPAAEGGFISGSMTIALASGFDQFSVLGCLIDAVSCLAGEELDLNFQIPSGQLNQTGVTVYCPWTCWKTAGTRTFKGP